MISREIRILPFLLIGCAQFPPDAPPTPLKGGDAEWPSAPIPQPGGEGQADESGEGGDEGTGGSGLTFIQEGDLGSSSSGCDPFMQDCPEGEKCVPYASSGGALDANKCVPVTGEGEPGDPCTYAGVVEATDDCNAVGICWDVQMSMGTCAGFCEGTSDAPVCPQGFGCLIANEGSVAVCTPDEGSDTGTESGTETGMPVEPDELEVAKKEPEPLAALEAECPDTTDPIVLYMSNDDSNSQASPILARRRIRDGAVVEPDDVRIHEFLNYYDLAYANPTDAAVDVGLQMRRTNPEIGEFTLLLSAQARALDASDRPPMNLVFSLDNSGSMEGERIELLKDSMTALAGALRQGDVVSMVRWDTSQAVLLAGHEVVGPDDPMLIAAIESLSASGGTDLNAGLTAGYALAEQFYIPGGLNRVVMISDGGANAGVTDLELIAAAAAAENEKVIYLMGVGVGTSAFYDDTLMDAVTDAGKGAYLFIDSPEEAEKMFGQNFVALASVAARDVKMRLTMPWYFGVKAFHGEEFSADPAEVEPQHLAPGDAMNFHQIIAACDPAEIDANDTIEAHVDYLDPLTLEPRTDSLSVKLGDLVLQDATQLHKADVIVGYAKALIVIGDRWKNGDLTEAVMIANAMTAWLEQAAQTLGDPEVEEIAALMGEYTNVLVGL
jgi:Mg-chelatase subunit ChlD